MRELRQLLDRKGMSMMILRVHVNVLHCVMFEVSADLSAGNAIRMFVFIQSDNM